MKQLWHKLTGAFRNLNKQERIVQSIRLITSTLTIIFCLTSLLAPLSGRRAYMYRINTSRLDLADGIYKSLRNSMSSSKKIDAYDGVYQPLGDSITNSEIALLTQYAQEHVATAPQYITASLWNWCLGFYDTYEEIDPNTGESITKTQHQSLHCERLKHAFDYRETLNDAGLDIIIAYAYQGDEYDDKNYDQTIKSRTTQFNMVPNSIIFACVSQAIVWGLTLVVYSNRGNEKDLSKSPKVLLHVIGLFSLASFISLMIGVATVTRLLTVTKHAVRVKLATYGIVYYFGKLWFGLIWAATFHALLSMCSWALPLWCANPEFPEDYHDEYEDQEFVFYPKIRTSTLPTMAKRKTSRPRFPKFKNAYIRMKEPLGSPKVTFQPRPSIENEQELRQLGEKLSKSRSVRRTNTKSSNKSPQNPFLDEGKNSKNIFYQEEVYDGYTSNNSSLYENRVRANTIESANFEMKDLPNEELSRTRQDYESARESILDDDEMEILDSQMFKLV